MLKKLALILLFSFSTQISIQAAQTDYITYEWLSDMAVSTSYTDHIPHWRRLFNTMKVRGLLECGCGFSTKYFLDNAEHVILIEYINSGYSSKWYYDCVSLFSDYTNWTPIIYNEESRSNSFNNACAYQCRMHKDYALIDATYLKELFQHYKTLIKNAQTNGYPIDVAFVDPGCYVRGDMVKLLLAHKVPIVVAHDTASDAGTDEITNLYGWNKVNTPPNYVKIYVPFGQGTTFWISDQLPDVITSMQDYRDQILQFIELGFYPNIKDVTNIADDIL